MEKARIKTKGRAMNDNKKKRDIISEQQFNIHGQLTHSSPGEDSPGDSDQAVGEEFLMGLNYMPDEKNEFENAGDEPGEIVFSDEKSTSPSETPSQIKFKKDATGNRLPNNAKVISSDQPAPWKDLDTLSDTH
jgi:hypothetical protein